MALWCVVSVLALAGAYLAGTLVRSPWQDATANSRAVLTVTADVVSKTPQAEAVSVQGVLSRGQRIAVSVPGAGATRSVVTGVSVHAGDVVRSGDRIVEVSGRPSIGLALSVPLYRDLEPGDQGDDVREVQEELTRLGFYSGRADGTFGAGTSAAVAALYRAAGSTPPAASDDRASALADAQQALDEASTGAGASSGGTREGAGTGTDAGAGSGGGSDLAALRTARDQAAVAAGAWLPLDEVTVVPQAGATVVSSVSRGTVLQDGQSPASLRSGSTEVTVRVPVDDADAFAPKTHPQVALASDDTVSASGTVTKVSGFRKGGGDDDEVPGYDVVVTLSGTAADTFSDGDSVLVRAQTGSRTLSASLAVPLVALRGDGADTSYVDVVTGTPQDKEPTTRRVDVAVDLQQDGWAFVTAKGLTAGDKVTIGGAS